MDKTPGEIDYETMAQGRLTNDQIDALTDADKLLYLAARTAQSAQMRAVDLRRMEATPADDAMPQLATQSAIDAYRRQRDATL